MRPETVEKVAQAIRENCPFNMSSGAATFLAKEALAALEATDEWKEMVADADGYNHTMAEYECDLKDFGGCGPVRLCQPCESRRKLAQAAKEG